MIPLEQENNSEVLRQYAIWMRDELKFAQKTIQVLQESIGSSNQQWLSQSLEDQLHRLQKKFYGFGRESISKESLSRPIGHVQQDLLIHGARAQSEIEPKYEEKSSDKSKILATYHDFVNEDILAENKSRGLDMGLGKEAWNKMPDFFQESTEITVTERVYQKVVHRQAKYRLKDEYNTTGKEVIITAPGPVKVRPGSQYSVEFAIAVVCDKYEYHLPLERQCRKMAAAGFEVDSKTLYGLCEAVAIHGNSILADIKKEIQNDFCAVHLDESPWRILSSGEQGYLWVMSNRLGSYYQFEPTRSGKVAAEMLGDYSGAIVTDAYGGYNRLANQNQIRIQHCWSHARREFYERFDDYPIECGKAIEIIDELFAIERRAKTLEDLRKFRASESALVIQRLHEFLLVTRNRFLSTEGISKAIQYCFNQWKGLTHFLTDITVPLTNNDAERALRHAVVGRKNFLGSQSINGADTMATLYTLIETSKKNSLQPSEYLRYLITERWYKRKPLTPQKYANMKFGENKDLNWPSRNDWKI